MVVGLWLLGRQHTTEQIVAIARMIDLQPYMIIISIFLWKELISAWRMFDQRISTQNGSMSDLCSGRPFQERIGFFKGNPDAKK
jgi:hypothetical protein